MILFVEKMKYMGGTKRWRGKIGGTNEQIGSGLMLSVKEHFLNDMRVVAALRGSPPIIEL